jgi:hypothetical protein
LADPDSAGLSFVAVLHRTTQTSASAAAICQFSHCILPFSRSFLQK